MKSTITIYYPISFETKEVLETVKNYGTVIKSPANMDTREFNTDLPRKDLEVLEKFLTENEVPYDLMEYGTSIKSPKLFKSRPDQEFAKEISCEFYQKEEEDGLIAVSTLLEIIENSKNEEVSGKILEEIKKATFKFDNVENIFEM